jgi:hypothetical protein
MSFTKNPMNPINANPIAVAKAILENSNKNNNNNNNNNYYIFF